MEKTKKIRCWSCGHLEAIKWGVRKGKQRYKCKKGGIFFTHRSKGISKKESRDLI